MTQPKPDPPTPEQISMAHQALAHGTPQQVAAAWSPIEAQVAANTEGTPEQPPNTAVAILAQHYAAWQAGGQVPLAGPLVHA